MRYLLTGMVGLVWAQQVYCGFDEYRQWLLLRDPEIAVREARMKAAGAEAPPLSLRTEAECASSQHVIPVVFHVIYSGPSDSVGHERVWGQLWRIHEDFRRIPETAGYSGSGADMQIEFSLATKAPDGRDTIGIVYWRYDQPPLRWSSEVFCRQLQDEDMKRLTAWDPAKYLNIWIVPKLCVLRPNSNACDPDSCGNLAGYASFPSISPSQAFLYGSVVGQSFFWGSELERRSIRTTVHELGHNLNLYHPFQSGCGTANCAQTGDEVCDTPPTSNENFSVVRQNTCNERPIDRPDNTRNIMDYVNDVDMTHFTAGQRSRAWSAINASYSRLYPLTRVANRAATGTGPYGYVKAYFTAYPRVACVGQPVRFYGTYSYGMPHIFRWDFGDGVADDPSSSCPAVTFPAPGTYSVQLIVENLSGRRDTLIKSDYITVYDTVFSVPYREGFEGRDFPPPYSYIDNPDVARGERTWELFRSDNPPRGAFRRSPSSLRLYFFTYSHYHEKDSWITPPIQIPSLPQGVNAFLRFSYAYACLDYENMGAPRPSYPLDYQDSLRIYVSTDCGTTWRLLWEKGGRDLATKAEECISVSGSIRATHLFVPTANEWDSLVLNLSAYSGKKINLRFEGVSGWGNNLYIDDIVVDTTSRPLLGLSRSAARFSAYLAPEALSLTVSQGLPAARIELYDALGRRVWQREEELLAGTHTWPLPVPLSPGVYILRVATSDHLWVTRLIP